MDSLQNQIYQAIHLLEIAKQFQGRRYEVDIKKVVKDLLEDSVKEVLPLIDEGAPTPSAEVDPPHEGESTSEEELQGMPDLEETCPSSTQQPPLTHSPIQLAEPKWEAVEDDEHTETNTTSIGGTKKDFTRWCKTLDLEEGHPFFYIKGGQSVQVFNLVYRRDGIAHIQVTCSDGTILIGSPRSVLKAYIRKTTNKEKQINPWMSLSMQSPNGLTKWSISERLWMNYEWNSKTKRFDSIV